MVDARHAASIAHRVEEAWQAEKNKTKLPATFEERAKRVWLKRSYFHMVEEVVFPSAAKSMASVPPKASPVKRRQQESAAKRQCVNPQIVQIMQAGVAWCSRPEYSRGMMPGCFARKLRSNSNLHDVFEVHRMETCPAAAIVVEGVVVRVEDVRQVDRATGDSVSLLSFLLADATGVVSVEVWGDEAAKLAEQLDTAVSAADAAANGPLFAGVRITHANIASPGQTYHALKILKVGRSTRVECLGPRNADAVPWAALPAVTNLTLLRSCSLPILVSESGLQGVLRSTAEWGKAA